MPKVLLMDSDAAFAAAVKPALEAKGFQLIHAPSCEDGLAKLRGESPDAIAVDMVFDGKGLGILAARKLRRSAAYSKSAKIPLLMLCGLKTALNVSFPKPSKYPLRLPVDEVMEKPVQPEAFASKLAEMLSGK